MTDDEEDQLYSPQPTSVILDLNREGENGKNSNFQASIRSTIDMNRHQNREKQKKS